MNFEPCTYAPQRKMHVMDRIHADTAYGNDSQSVATNDAASTSTLQDEVHDAATPSREDCALWAEHLSLSWDTASAANKVHNSSSTSASLNEPALVVRDVSLHVSKGETVCLVGRSGCGKTTILHALAGLLPAVRGDVRSFGNDITNKPGQVSYMFQRDLLLEHMSVIDNVCLPLVMHGVPKQQARARVAELFEPCGLAGYEQAWPSQLSGGMRQRVAFMRTYAMGNSCVLLDEPFSALDAITRVEMRSWYLRMARLYHLSTLAITHDVDEALMMAQRVYILAKPTAHACEDAACAPATIVGEVAVAHSADMSAADFALTDEFLHAKRQVMALL